MFVDTVEILNWLKTHPTYKVCLTVSSHRAQTSTAIWLCICLSLLSRTTDTQPEKGMKSGMITFSNRWECRQIFPSLSFRLFSRSTDWNIADIHPVRYWLLQIKCVNTAEWNVQVRRQMRVQGGDRLSETCEVECMLETELLKTVCECLKAVSPGDRWGERHVREQGEREKGW